MPNKGMVFDIQRFSLHDGPGVRTLVFLKGCPLRCKWCHNPEGISDRVQLIYTAARCVGCGACALACPTGAHRIADGVHRFERDRCVPCGACAQACNAEALRMVGKQMSVDEVMEEVVKDRIYYGREGGVTLSGGEPMRQPQFALALLREAKKRCLTTCMETCGYAPARDFEQIIPYVDTVLFDYKLTDEQAHLEMTGVPREPILKSLRLLDRMGCAVTLRCPIIPGVNMDEGHLAGIAALCEAHRSIGEVHIEPYHDLGVGKASNLATGEAPYIPPAIERERYREFLLALRERTTVPCHIV